MTKQIVATTHAPKALGPYSQAVRAGAYIFTAGQLGLDPATGKLAEGVEAQTKQALTNLAAVLEAAGSGLDRAVKTTCFLANMADFQVFNAVYATFFPENPPARSTIQAGALPAGAQVEIEVIALAE